MNRCSPANRHRASALIAVYWAIAILSTTVVTTAMLLVAEVKSRSVSQLEVQADALAQRGVAIAMHPSIEQGDSLLISGPITDEEGYETSILSESARINLNAMLAWERRRPLEDLFVLWGMERVRATELVDRLLDWIDPDNRVDGRGAERRDYQALGLNSMPFNRQFMTLDEVPLVLGFEEVIQLRPDWRDAFTLWGDGRVDLNDAEPDVIAAVCGCSLEIAIAFVDERRGPDARENTDDDLGIVSVEDIMIRVGASTASAEWVTIRPSALRIESIGWVQQVQVRRTLVLPVGGQGSLLDFEYRRL